MRTDSLAKFEVDSSNYKKMISEDKHNTFITNLSAEEIWQFEILTRLLDDLNKNIKKIIYDYNNSLINSLLCQAGVDKRLSDDFCFKRGNYSDRLKNNYNELEYTIEILMRLLNFCGYNAEKTERTAISSTHDVTHCIYATGADRILTMDERFAKKCGAVYKFLGVDTQVIFCKTNEQVLENM